MKNSMTYRNSCLAVLVGDVGKSSNLQMQIQGKAGKQKGSNQHSYVSELQQDCISGNFTNV